MIEELGTDLVTLRRFRLEDTPELIQAVQESIEHLHPWLPWCGTRYQASEAEEWVRMQREFWEEGREFEFSIRDADGVLVGGCGLNQIHVAQRMANLGYWVRSGCTGRGYATEAARLAARFGIRELGLHRIEIVAAVKNIPSRKVAERVGAVRECRLRGRLLIHGQIHDAVLYSLLPQDLT